MNFHVFFSGTYERAREKLCNSIFTSDINTDKEAEEFGDPAAKRVRYRVWIYLVVFMYFFQFCTCCIQISLIISHNDAVHS